MESVAYYDGRIGAPDELMVPFNDRGHFFGDGIYEAAVAAGGAIFAIEDHLDRFYSSAAGFDIRIPVTKDELASVLYDLLGRVDGRINVVYWQVTRGVALREHVYSDDMVGKLWAFVAPEPLPDPAIPLKLISRADRRFEYGNVKTLNLLPAVKYLQEGYRAGVDEVVLHRDGVVTECAHSNISILKDGIFRSHPNDEHILRGIAKTHLIQACYRESVPVIERAFTLDELADADEVIVTSSSNLCSFATELDGKPIGGRDPLTLEKIRRAVYDEFREYTGVDDLFS